MVGWWRLLDLARLELSQHSLVWEYALQNFVVLITSFLCSEFFFLIVINLYLSAADLEKAASGARGACGHFVRNHAFFRTFLVKYPVLLIEDGGSRVEDEELMLENGNFSSEDGE